MAAGNKNEVMKAMELMKQLKIREREITDKMAKIYEDVGEFKKANELKRIEQLRRQAEILK